MNSRDKKTEMRQFFAQAVSKKTIAFDNSLQRSVTITPEMQEDLYQHFGIHPSLFETANELQRLLKKERLAQDFNPNHEPQGAPNGAGGEFSSADKWDNLPIDALPDKMPPNGLSILKNNMDMAQNFKKNQDAVNPVSKLSVYPWLYFKVHNHAPWDYKNIQDKQGKPHHEWADFGNFNYGAIGTALGLTEQTLLGGAGFAQSRAGTSEAKSGNWSDHCTSTKLNDKSCAFGDDYKDQNWIKRGIYYAKTQGYGSERPF